MVSCAVHRCSHPGCERVWMSPSWHQVLTEEGGKKHLMELASVFVRAVHGEERLSNFFLLSPFSS